MQTKFSRPKVAAIILDSSDAALIERGIDEGWMPNLARFRKRGGYGRLTAGSDQINASAWPGFITGQHAGDHGVWNYLTWDAQSLTHVPCAPKEQNFTPFWRALCQQGHRCVVLDVPRTYPPEEPFDGVEFGGWGTHYKLTDPYAQPESFLQWVTQTIGKEPIGNEPGGDLTASVLLAELQRIINTTRLQAELAVETLKREPCELFIAAFSGPHRAGHMLWDCTGLATPPTDEQREQLDLALQQVYTETDAALGRVLHALGQDPDATTLVFSLHGMGPNTSLADMLPQMLDCVLHDKRAETNDGLTQKKKKGLLSAVRQAVPLSFRNAVKDALPKSVQHQLTMFWRKQNRDWSTTPAFTLMADLQGFVRINLKGRESQGIIEPGAEYDALCEKIIAGLKTFVHADTGKPAVVDVQRMDELYPDAERVPQMPDLVVQWSERPAADCIGVTSPRYGTILWPTPGRIADGRSGHHRTRGWLAAVNKSIAPNSSIEGYDALDLPPTLCRLINAPVQDTMVGEPIHALMPKRYSQVI